MAGKKGVVGVAIKRGSEGEERPWVMVPLKILQKAVDEDLTLLVDPLVVVETREAVMVISDSI